MTVWFVLQSPDVHQGPGGDGVVLQLTPPGEWTFNGACSHNAVPVMMKLSSL